MLFKSLKDLFVHEFADTCNAGKQMTRSPPRLARAATNPAVRSTADAR